MTRNLLRNESAAESRNRKSKSNWTRKICRSEKKDKEETRRTEKSKAHLFWFISLRNVDQMIQFSFLSFSFTFKLLLHLAFLNNDKFYLIHIFIRGYGTFRFIILFHFRRPRKSGIRVSKYELFGASKEEKFPPKFLQANINKEKTALQKAVEVRIVCKIRFSKNSANV